MHILHGLANFIVAALVLIGATTVFACITVAGLYLEDTRRINPANHPLAKREQEEDTKRKRESTNE